MAIEIQGSKGGLKETLKLEVVVFPWSAGTHQVHASLAMTWRELAQPTDASYAVLVVTCCLG